MANTWDSFIEDAKLDEAKKEIDWEKVGSLFKKIRQEKERSKSYMLHKKFHEAFEDLFQHLENNVDAKLASDMSDYMMQWTDKFFKRMNVYVKQGK